MEKTILHRLKKQKHKTKKVIVVLVFYAAQFRAFGARDRSFLRGSVFDWSWVGAFSLERIFNETLGTRSTRYGHRFRAVNFPRGPGRPCRFGVQLPWVQLLAENDGKIADLPKKLHTKKGRYCVQLLRKVAHRKWLNYKDFLLEPVKKGVQLLGKVAHIFGWIRVQLLSKRKFHAVKKVCTFWDHECAPGQSDGRLVLCLFVSVPMEKERGEFEGSAHPVRANKNDGEEGLFWAEKWVSWVFRKFGIRHKISPRRFQDQIHNAKNAVI